VRVARVARAGHADRAERRALLPLVMLHMAVAEGEHDAVVVICARRVHPPVRCGRSLSVEVAGVAQVHREVRLVDAVKPNRYIRSRFIRDIRYPLDRH